MTPNAALGFHRVIQHGTTVQFPALAPGTKVLVGEHEEPMKVTTDMGGLGLMATDEDGALRFVWRHDFKEA